MKERLREARERQDRATVVALALIEPRDPLLDQLRYAPMEIGQQFLDWVTAVHLASARSGADEFVDVALAMINRDAHGIWDFQEVTNRGIVERLQRDPEAIRRLKDKLASNATENG